MITPLQFKVYQVNNESLSLKVEFQDPFFSKSLRLGLTNLFSFQNFLYLQVYTKSIQFHSINKKDQMESTQEKLIQFSKILKDNLSRISSIVLQKQHWVNDEQLSYILKLTNLSSLCLGFKVAKKDIYRYKKGAFVIFFDQANSKTIQNILQEIRGFSQEILGYPLTDLSVKHKIASQVIRNTFSLMISAYADQLQSVANFYHLHIVSMGIGRRFECIEKDNRNSFEQAEDTKEYFIIFHIMGSIFNIHQFYLGLENTLNSIPLNILQRKQLRCPKIGEQNMLEQLSYSQKNRMLNGSSLLLMNRNICFEQLQSLTIGSFILTDKQISKQYRQILKTQEKQRRYREYLIKKSIFYEELQINDSFIRIKCIQRKLKHIIRQLNKYLSQFQRQQAKVEQLSDSLLSGIFFKQFQSSITQDIHVKFSIRDGLLYRANFTVDSQQIEEQIKYVKETHIIPYFTYVPSLKNISNHLAKSLGVEGLYRIDKNPPSCWENSLRSIKFKILGKIDIFLSELNNLVKYQNQMIIFYQSQWTGNRMINQIIASHKIDINEFLINCENEKSCRVRKYSTRNSLRFKNVTLFYVNIKKINYRHVDEDTISLLKTFQAETNLNFIIAADCKNFLNQFFTKFYLKFYNIILQNKIKMKLKSLNFYLQDTNSFLQFERIVNNPATQTVFLSRDIFNQWSLLKMNNLKQYVVSYFWKNDTYTLPGIDSYIFRFQSLKSSRGRALVSIPLPGETDGYNQFFIDLKQQLVFEVRSLNKIVNHKIEKISKQFQKFIRLIEKQFISIDYFVIYAMNSKEHIGSKIYLNIYYKSDKRAQLIGLKFQNGFQSVAPDYSKQPLIYAITSKKYVDWFKIYSHSKILDLIQKCLQK